MPMKRSIDHDLYVAKNRALAVAEDMKRRDETVERPALGRAEAGQDQVLP